MAAYGPTKLTTTHTLFAPGRSSPHALYRFYYTSLPLQRKSTTSIRRERAEAQPKPPSAMQTGVLFEKNRFVPFPLLPSLEST